MASIDTELSESSTAVLGRLQARHVAVFAFAMTCSGPFGVESCVRSFGPWWTCTGLAFSTVFYVLPQILMTCELSLILPLSNGGIAAWVVRAFGPTVAAAGSLNMLVYQIVDLATYPTLVVGYAEAVKYDIPDFAPMACAYFVVIAGLILNLFRIEVATDLYTVLLALILLPFAIGIAISFPSWHVALAEVEGASPATDFPARPAMSNVNVFLCTMMWLNTGWDSIGNLASEVSTPGAMVRGLAIAATACPVVYLSCTFVALAAGPGSWDDGYLATAYGRFWAPLTPWIVVTAGLANFLLYVSELTCAANLIQSMANPVSGSQFLPKMFSRQLASGAPVVALVIVTFVVAILVSGLLIS